MIKNSKDYGQHLEELRRTFDEAFALPPLQVPEDLTEFALLVLGKQRYAIRISQLVGLEVDRKVEPLPAEVRGLLGLSAVKGQLVPVFDLAALVGSMAGSSTPRWMALHRDKELVGLAFDEFAGSHRVPARAVHALESASKQNPWNRQVVEMEAGLVPVLDVSLLVSSIALREDLSEQS